MARGNWNLCWTPKRAADVALILGLAVLYCACARLGLAFNAVSGFASLVWPPTGIAEVGTGTTASVVLPAA